MPTRREDGETSPPRRADGSAAAEGGLRRLLDELAAAHLRSDGAALDRLRAADYVFTTADGRLLEKTQAAAGSGD